MDRAVHHPCSPGALTKAAAPGRASSELGADFGRLPMPRLFYTVAGVLAQFRFCVIQSLELVVSLCRRCLREANTHDKLVSSVRDGGSDSQL